MTRLESLIELRARLDSEIARERASLAIHAAAHAYKVTPDDIRGRSRQKRIAKARHVTAWILRQHGLSYPEIGRAIGRDHKTVMHGVRRVDNDPKLRRTADKLHAAETRAA